MAVLEIPRDQLSKMMSKKHKIDIVGSYNAIYSQWQSWWKYCERGRKIRRWNQKSPCDFIGYTVHHPSTGIRFRHLNCTPTGLLEYLLIWYNISMYYSIMNWESHREFCEETRRCWILLERKEMWLDLIIWIWNRKRQYILN